MKVLVIGAGISGATLARLHADNKDEVLVLDSRNHIAGNCYDYVANKTYIHAYGPHIWHNSNIEIENFVRRFTKFNEYTHRVSQSTDIGTLNYPLDPESMCKIYNVDNFDDIKIDKLYDNPSNMEELAINKIGKKAYDLYIKHYTKRQWGAYPNELDKNLANRLGVTSKSNAGLFDKDTYTGMPSKGYSSMIKSMLESDYITIELNRKFTIHDLKSASNLFDRIYYTGSVDELCNNKFGELPYIYVDFVLTEIPSNLWETNKSVENISKSNWHTNRRTNYNYFGYDDEDLEKHIIMTEYPSSYGTTKCYPMVVKNYKYNKELYNRYKYYLKNNYPNVVLAGRLGLYQYLDMNKAIESAMNIYNNLQESK